MKVVLIYNPKSGGEYTLQALKRMLKHYDVTVDYSFTVKQLGSRKLKELINKGVIVMAVGGDGTLNSVAGLVVSTKSRLLPMPGGTFNHFVRDLGMSVKMEENLAALKQAKTIKIDVAEVNGEVFLNNSNLGLYPFSLIERKKAKKIIGKWPAAILSAFDQIVSFRRHKLKIDGETVHSPFVFVGNNIYDTSSSLVPQRSNLSDGLLTTMVASSSSRLALARAIFAVMRGDVSHRDDFVIQQRTELSIYSPKPRLLVSLDGEVKNLDTPLHYRIRPKVLKIIIVKPSTG